MGPAAAKADGTGTENQGQWFLEHARRPTEDTANKAGTSWPAFPRIRSGKIHLLGTVSTQWEWAVSAATYSPVPGDTVTGNCSRDA